MRPFGLGVVVGAAFLGALGLLFGLLVGPDAFGFTGAPIPALRPIEGVLG